MGLSLVLAIFFLPETRFSRPPMAFSGKTVYTDEFGHTHVLTHEEAQERFGRVQTHLEAPKPKRTFVQELQPWSDIAPNALSVWLGAYAKILKSCTSPAVIFALLLSSISLGKCKFGLVIDGLQIWWNMLTAKRHRHRYHPRLQQSPRGAIPLVARISWTI